MHNEIRSPQNQNVGAPLMEVRLTKSKVHTVRTCRECGCTDDDCSGCIERTGMPCHWVTMDLCSACVEDDQPQRKKGRRRG
jgi:hypothetical protein